MNIQNKEQMVVYMQEEIEQLARKEEKQWLQKTNALEQEVCQKIQAEVEKEMAEEITKELANMNVEYHRQAATYNKQRKEQLMLTRQTYVDTIFTEAKAALLAFTKTKDYQMYIKNKIQHVQEQYSLQNCTLYRKAGDTTCESVIQALSLDSVTIIISADITIGGCIIENNTTRIDLSLDAALEQQKEWFYQASAFNIH